MSAAAGGTTWAAGGARAARRTPHGGPGAGGRRRRAGARLLRRAVALFLLVLAVFGVRAAAYALYPFPYPRVVRADAARAALDPLLVLAVMRTESRFRPMALSVDGAVGLMQLTPPTAAWVALQRGWPAPTAARLPDPAYNIAIGVWYLGRLRGDFGGRLVPALAAYNAGPGPVRSWLATGSWDGRAATADRIPFPETRRFVQRVLGAYGVYRLLYRGP